ncbi:MAG TPA: hypothetical protein VHG27_09885 [Xanthobacteraceae bacterium]|jgi:hypothetical protein|nr:hypothetical protein [Xanthobacteraceae bacterium]
MVRLFTAAALAVALATAAVSSASAQPKAVPHSTVGPWSVIGWVSSDDPKYCSAERDVGEVRVAFVRFQSGYAVIVRSPEWFLAAGSTHQLQLVAASVTSMSVTARVVSSNIMIAMLDADAATMRRVAAAQELTITAAGTTVKVPAEKLVEALTALDDCVAQQPQPAPPPQARPNFPVPVPNTKIEPLQMLVQISAMVVAAQPHPTGDRGSL